MEEKTISLMGGEVYYYIQNKKNRYESEILEFMIAETKRLISLFNFFEPTSQLSKLNHSREIAFDKEMAFLLSEGIRFFHLSSGKFSIFLGKEKLRRKNSLDISAAPMFCSPRVLQINHEKIILVEPNCTIDLGGIAKGYIADRVLEKTVSKYKGETLDIQIDARGDIVCFGKEKKYIEVENPFDEKFSVSLVEMKSGAIITSGHNKQYFKNGSHIIGKESDILTLSLRSEKEKCYVLDAYGTYLLQLSSEEVLNKVEFEAEFEHIECFLILKKGKILKSSFW